MSYNPNNPESTQKGNSMINTNDPNKCNYMNFPNFDYDLIKKMSNMNNLPNNFLNQMPFSNINFLLNKKYRGIPKITLL